MVFHGCKRFRKFTLQITELLFIIKSNKRNGGKVTAWKKLRRRVYKKTADYGHFGKTDVNLPWEHLDKVEEIKKIVRREENGSRN